MDRIRLQILHDVVSEHRDQFDMNVWQDGGGIEGPIIKRSPGEEFCGTSACLAGWAVFLFGSQYDGLDPNESDYNRNIMFDLATCDYFRLAKDLLDLSYEQAAELFYPSNYRWDLPEDTSRRVVQGEDLEEKDVVTLKDAALQRLKEYIES